MRFSEVEAMEDTCRNCLAQDVCDITGASCKKMGALFSQRKSVTNGRTTMSNTAKNSATPKDVKEAVENKAEETTVPAQATGEKTVKDGQLDKVLDNAGKVLFSGTPDEVKNWLIKQPAMIYAVRQAKNNDLVISTVYVEEGPLKLSLVQRAKAAAEKLKKNKKALAIIGGAVVVAGLAIKNNRKTVAEEITEEETLDDVEVTVENPDDNPDSL